ncbi:MAG TPA: deoxyribodipyrimidine photo-lyase [Spongiibacteraceae bacterium]|nr:deoxyribodipyrimidine photo-lyase [Spongiibacteraceae bacterium]
MTSLVWFRNDLRVDDNTALREALAEHKKIAAVFYAIPEQWRAHDMAPVKAEFLWRNLECLRIELNKINIPLLVRSVPLFNNIADDLALLTEQLKVTAVYANREYAVDELRRDAMVEQRLMLSGVAWFAYDDATLLPPGSVRTQQGQPYKVYTPFRRAVLNLLGSGAIKGKAIGCKAERWRDPPPLPAYPYESSTVAADLWPAGEAFAAQRLQAFLAEKVDDYKQQRDLPGLAGTSGLSPYLSLGVISLRRCVEAALAVAASNSGELWQSGDSGVGCWLNELIWREFYQHVLAQFPRVSKHQPLRSETERVPWRRDAAEFSQWCVGRTGFPLIDAAMRQLCETGWMHNRLRMVTAMFLSKYLLLDWRWGERYFMQQLIDGDLAANNGGWQWSASTGTDAVPYFRLLSPVRQAERFDADAQFCKRFLPELGALPAKIILQPGHPQLLSTGYPPPMVDLKFARSRALAAFSPATSTNYAEAR